MAVRELNKKPGQRGDLLNPLEDELRRDDATPAPEGAPIIYRDQSHTAERYTNWYVVWDKFEGVDDEERSQLILTAVENVCGVEEALRVTIAMGLTPSEAENVGIPPL